MGVSPTAANTAYTTNALNQYTAVGSFNPTHDDDGNQLTAQIFPVESPAPVPAIFHWDAENRLIKVTDPTETTTIVEYAYDYIGRRISEQATISSLTTTTRWIYDGWNMLTEYTGTTLSKRYLWGMDLSGSMQGAGGVGGLLSVNDGTATYYPTYDGNGNVSEYLDSTGAVQAHYEYDPFGRTTVATGAKAQDFSHRFSTKPLDAETGLYYDGYRYYDPVTGRWPSRDPIEEEGGNNLYGFVGNDGINTWDYLGFLDWSNPALIGQNTQFPNDPLNMTFDAYEVKTGAGNPITTFLALKSHQGAYMCHFYTFGGHTKGLNIFGATVPQILSDDGWEKIKCCDAKSEDIFMNYGGGGKIEHSGIIQNIDLEPVQPGVPYISLLRIDEQKSKFKSKWGFGGGLKTTPFTDVANRYGKYSCFSKDAGDESPCCVKSVNEI